MVLAEIVLGGVLMQNITMNPIGYVRNNVQNKKDTSWGKDVSEIKLNEEYYTGLKGLDDFSTQ